MAAKKQAAERLQVRHSLRALLRDEIAQNQEFLRKYQAYLEQTKLDTHELTMTERYDRLMARQIHVWHAMWQGQAQHLGVILEPNEIVATARFHNSLDALVTDWMALDTMRRERDETFKRIRSEHSDPVISERLNKGIAEGYYEMMREPYRRFTQESLHNLINTSNPIGPDD
jgi:hypothetical protein